MGSGASTSTSGNYQVQIARHPVGCVRVPLSNSAHEYIPLGSQIFVWTKSNAGFMEVKFQHHGVFVGFIDGLQLVEGEGEWVNITWQNGEVVPDPHSRDNRGHREPAVVHLTKNNGRMVTAVTLREFCENEGAKELFVVKHGDNFDGEMSVARARASVGIPGYSLVFGNCEHFASYCAQGEVSSQQVDENIMHMKEYFTAWHTNLRLSGITGVGDGLVGSQRNGYWDSLVDHSVETLHTALDTTVTMIQYMTNSAQRRFANTVPYICASQTQAPTGTNHLPPNYQPMTGGC